MAHDLGHPPFGHNGERALADIAGNIGGFEGNAQTMRILTRLEPKIFHPDGRSAGVNLTRAALDAAVKYPWTLAEADQHPKGERSKKFCVYPDDEPVFRWLKIGAPQATKPMECQIMDLSDDIAYSVHDVEDSIATGAFDPIVLADPKMLDHIIEQTRAWYGAKWDADKLLAAFTDLVDVLMADSPLPSDALESQFLADWNESTNDDERLRVAIDQVASLTDNSALALHSILC